MTDPGPAAPVRRFELVERIGAGAHGEVYLAEQHTGENGFQRRVALKLLHSDHKSPEIKQRIRDEARILGHVQHRSVVTAFDLVRLDDRWGVVMDYVPGCDLQELLAAQAQVGGQVPLAAALHIASEIAHALHAAWHSKDARGNDLRVVHRDIKPSNIRLTPDGDVKVLDFGIATAQMTEREASTGGQVMGTLAYMAPERLNGAKGTTAGDVYGLTMVAAELLLSRNLGRPPAAAEPHAVWVAAHVDALSQLLSSHLATSSLLIPLIERGLAFSMEDRPTAHELADQFDYLARSVPGLTARSYAADFVPRVEGILKRPRVPATGIIDADSGTWSSGGAVRTTPLPPALIGDVLTPHSTPPPVVHTPARIEPTPTRVFVAPTRSRAPLFLVTGAVLLFLVGALGMWGAAETDAPAAPEQPNLDQMMVVAEPGPEPGVEPVPPHDPIEPATEANVNPAKSAVADVPRPGPAPRPLAAPSRTEPTDPDATAAAIIEPEVGTDAQPAEPEVVLEDPAGTAEAPVAPPPVPVDVPPPAPVVYPSVGGTWVGTASGRPVTLRLQDGGAGAVAGRVELVLGPSVRGFSVSGTISPDGVFDLSDAKSGMRMQGTLSGGAIAGRYQAKSGGKWLPYNASQ